MVLRRIGVGEEPVSAKNPDLATTVYALRDRGLVGHATPRHAGTGSGMPRSPMRAGSIWSTVITLTDQTRVWPRPARTRRDEMIEIESGLGRIVVVGPCTSPKPTMVISLAPLGKRTSRSSAAGGPVIIRAPQPVRHDASLSRRFCRADEGHYE